MSKPDEEDVGTFRKSIKREPMAEGEVRYEGTVRIRKCYQSREGVRKALARLQSPVGFIEREEIRDIAGDLEIYIERQRARLWKVGIVLGFALGFIAPLITAPLMRIFGG